MITRAAGLLLILCACAQARAQFLEVTLAPASPPSVTAEADADIWRPVALFQFTATGGPVTIDGLILTQHGGQHANSVYWDVTGFQVWHDNGDGLFDSDTDTRLSRAKTYSERTLLPFNAPIIVNPGTPIQTWIIMHFSEDTSDDFTMSLEHPYDVVSPDAFVTFGTPAPRSGVVEIRGHGHPSLDDLNYDPYECSAHRSAGVGVLIALAISAFVAGLRRNCLRGRVRRQYAG
jgi:hypothetical protein